MVGAVDKDVGACIEVIGDEGVALGERGIVFGGEGERLVVEVDAIVDLGSVEQNAVDVGDGENEFGASEFIIGVIRLVEGDDGGGGSVRHVGRYGAYSRVGEGLHLQDEFFAECGHREAIGFA